MLMPGPSQFQVRLALTELFQVVVLSLALEIEYQERFILVDAPTMASRALPLYLSLSLSLALKVLVVFLSIWSANQSGSFTNLSMKSSMKA